MSYPHGYPQGQYAGYQGYGQVPQTHMYQANQAQYQQQHPMVVVPTQPRREVSNFQTSPHLSQPPYQPGFQQQPQQPPVRFQQPNQQQFYPSQGQQYPSQGRHQQQAGNWQQQYSNQNFYQPPRSQPVYQPTQRYQQQLPSPQLQYQQQPRLPTQSASPQFPVQPLPVQSGSPPLPQVSQPYVHPQALINQTRQQQPHAHAEKPQQRSHQRAQILSSPDPLQQQSSPSQRVVARVEIPIQRSPSTSTKSEMAPAPKRRRSNEGHAIACEAPVQAKRAVSHQQMQGPASSSPLTQLNSSQMPPTPTPMLKPEYQPMLLALADEYIHAAYSMSSHVDSDEKRSEYHHLMSMGMACLESLLNNYRQSDVRREARIRLRLASLMVDETDNDEETEAILSKGIAMCGQNRLVDLKYAMQHLSVRLMFRRSAKAGFKSADKFIEEVESLKLQRWIYTFRFLRISLSLQSGSQADLSAALKHLNAVNALADDQRNASVQIVAASMEALIHLRMGSSEAGDLAHRAMAAARTHQLGPEMQALPQMRGLLDCLDLMCALVQSNQSQAAAKMSQMHANMDQGTRDSGWTKDGSFFLPLCPTDNEQLGQDADGIMRVKNGEACLVVKWITGTQLYTLGFLLSGLTKMLFNKVDGSAENFFSEGLKMTKVTPSSVRQSLSNSEAGTDQRESFNIVLNLYVAFYRCGQGDWQSARTAIQELRKQFAAAGTAVDESTQRVLLYLEGLCRQGLGELKGAVQLYESPLLTPQPESKANVMEEDLRVLATLNRIFILRSFGSDGYKEGEDLLAAVEPYCRDHPNESFLAVCHILKASVQDLNGTVIKKKQYIQSAIQASKKASNNQLIYVLMNLMTESFFHNTIVGDQAEKAAHAGRSLARSARSKLWTVVADTMYADIMERCGRLAEAEGAKREALNFYPDLPESLKEKL